jgi:hypothetical protein
MAKCLFEILPNILQNADGEVEVNAYLLLPLQLNEITVGSGLRGQ